MQSCLGVVQQTKPSILTGFQMPSRPLAIGPLYLLWANQIDINMIKGSPRCECIRAIQWMSYGHPEILSQLTQIILGLEIFFLISFI